MTGYNPAVEEAYRHCVGVVRGHYENFPVASVALPKPLRRPIAAIYAFARRADDLADEQALSDEQRLDELDAMDRALDDIEAGRPVNGPVFIALADAVRRYRLPLPLFHDLLSAFRQDVTKKRYADFEALMDYCRRSANPIGRLLLHLSYEATDKNIKDSDAVCSALQLINFYQDLASDYEVRGRIYIPQDEMARFDVTEEHFARRLSDHNMHRLMQFQYRRAEQLLESGAPLGRALGGRLGVEIRMVIRGGLRVIHRLQLQDEDLFSRPRLDWTDWFSVLRSAAFYA